MKTVLQLLFILLWIASCETGKPMTYEELKEEFKKSSDKVLKLKYRVHRIDTFTGGHVWNHRGVALVERRSGDKMLGYSFYGKRDDFSQEFIYDNDKFFGVSRADKTYSVDRAGRGIMGSPGGQMVFDEFFALDSVYTSVSVKETDNSYVIRYEYPDDTLYNNTNSWKTIELDRTMFLPRSISRSVKGLDGKYSVNVTFDSLKINDEVTNSIDDLKSVTDIKDGISGFTMLLPPTKKVNPILGKQFRALRLENIVTGLVEEIGQTEDKKRKPILIDFWEHWCGPCIRSLPEVERLSKAYAEQLVVAGIAGDEKEKTLKRLEASKISFDNFHGNANIAQTFGVNSWPRYFLIDKNGVIRKEYHGFSDQIEVDIKAML